MCSNQIRRLCFLSRKSKHRLIQVNVFRLMVVEVHHGLHVLDMCSNVKKKTTTTTEKQTTNHWSPCHVSDEVIVTIVHIVQVVKLMCTWEWRPLVSTLMIWGSGCFISAGPGCDLLLSKHCSITRVSHSKQEPWFNKRHSMPTFSPFFTRAHFRVYYRARVGLNAWYLWGCYFYFLTRCVHILLWSQVDPRFVRWLQ